MTRTYESHHIGGGAVALSMPKRAYWSVSPKLGGLSGILDKVVSFFCRQYVGNRSGRLMAWGSALHQILDDYTTWAADLSPRTAKKMRHDLGRWKRLGGASSVAHCTTDTFADVRKRGLQQPLSADTIETTIGSIVTLLTHAKRRGRISEVPDIGRRLPRSQAPPDSPPVPHIGRLYAAIPKTRLQWPRLICCGLTTWWQSFLVAAYITGQRLEDLTRQLTWSDVDDTVVRFRPAKTTRSGKIIPVPLHPILRRHLMVLKCDWSARSNDDRVFHVSKSPHILRRELRRICDIAGVPHVTPQQIRRASATAYEVAHAGAGALIQGSAVKGSARYYIRVEEVLREAQRKLEIPDDMKTKEEISRGYLHLDELQQSFKQIDDERDRLTVVRLAETLVRAG